MRTRQALRVMAATTLAVGGLAVASIAGAPAGAAASCAGGTIVVSTAADTGAGSLRQAFADANTADGGTICIDTTVVTSPISITSGVLDYTGTGDLRILGNGAVVQGNSTSQMLYASVSGATFEIDHLTVTGGNASAGGGVRSGNGSVRVVDSAIIGNTASSFGAGVSGPDVTIIRSTIANNTVTDGDGAGINAGTATVINSTITGNSASTVGGGIEAGISVTLVYSTIVGNSAPDGANVVVNNDTPLDTFASVVAEPISGKNCNIDTTTTHGYNFSDDASCDFTDTANGDVENGPSPQLGTLAANGGPTLTKLPAPGSPLIDAIPTAACALDKDTATDQRGVTRPQLGGCDIGAVEVEEVAPTPITPVSPAAPVAVQPLFTG
jgi:hypothetical protein